MTDETTTPIPIGEPPDPVVAYALSDGEPLTTKQIGENQPQPIRPQRESDSASRVTFASRSPFDDDTTSQDCGNPTEDEAQRGFQEKKRGKRHGDEDGQHGEEQYSKLESRTARSSKRPIEIGEFCSQKIVSPSAVSDSYPAVVSRQGGNSRAFIHNRYASLPVGQGGLGGTEISGPESSLATAH